MEQEELDGCGSEEAGYVGGCEVIDAFEIPVCIHSR